MTNLPRHEKRVPLVKVVVVVLVVLMVLTLLGTAGLVAFSVSTESSSGLSPVSGSDPEQPVSSEDPLPSPSPSPLSTGGIDSFEECAAAGYPIAESYPEQCIIPGGQSFARPI